ncbi:MAG: hypothetical protein JOZ41_11355, partial [Chloroflexi bacterium]|nr:hypothetical protein [Chloroflexota bacterium]
VGQPLRPESTTAILSVVLLQAVSASTEEIAALARGTLAIDPKFLPHTNGHKPQEQPILPGFHRP